MTKNLTYKKCDMNDLDLLIDISKKTFIEAYEKTNNPDDFKIYIDSAFEHRKMATELDNFNSEFYFIYLNQKPAGYFKLNKNNAQGEPYGNDSLEISRIYLSTEFQGQNIGSSTLIKIRALAKEMAKTWLWLSVWQLNESAVRFYELHGFRKYDTQFFFVGNDRQVDWLMKLDLV